MKLGPYEVHGEIGRGAMGRVCRATHGPTGVERAIKLIDAPNDPEAIARFQREAEVLARAAGRGVVTVHDSGIEGRTFWYAMDVMRGGSLTARVRERGGVLPWREGCKIVHALARALGRCHAAGVVHRDLKPDNVLFDESGEPCLADFGCARDLQSMGMTVEGSIVGTPLYMAPEQLAGLPAGPSADVFALAIMLHEIVTGERPFVGTTLTELLLAASGGHRLKTREVAGVPIELDGILDRALAYDDTRRTPDGDALAKELGALLEGKTTAVKPVATGRGPRRAPLALAVFVAVSVLGGALAVSRSGTPAGGSAPPPPPADSPPHPTGLPTPPRQQPPPPAPAETPEKAAAREVSRALRAVGNRSGLMTKLSEALPLATLAIDALAAAKSASLTVAAPDREALVGFARNVMSRCVVERRPEGVAAYLQLYDLEDDRSCDRIAEALVYLGAVDAAPVYAERILIEGRRLIDSPEANDAQRSEAYCRMAQVLSKREEHERGDALLAEGLARIPDSGAMLKLRVSHLWGRRLLQRALDVSGEETDRIADPEVYVPILETRAIMLVELGAVAKARDEIARVRKQSHFRSWTYLLRARINHLLGVKETVLADLVEARRLARVENDEGVTRGVEETAKAFGLTLPPR